ncbi:hypothetical protein SAMN04488103_109171 [Gemmobacter aquatilis]|uniref:Phage regulatory protein CII (CP76) n=2 Tax=Gemmobacter aquatilis TaxID=933059 RepID=A0A1H8KQP3_9RHOB|nr:hypothetical protein SAMN04488103_109171 [Gemmobacter aquatilis]
MVTCMSDPRPIIHAHVCALIDRLGGVTAANAVLEARWGGGHSAGTLSKKRARQLDWTLPDILALQEAAGDWSLFDWLMGQVPAEARSVCLVQGVADLSREVGEAQHASLSAVADPAMRPQAAKELQDVIEKAQRLQAALSRGAEGRG